MKLEDIVTKLHELIEEGDISERDFINAVDEFRIQKNWNKESS